MRRRGGRQRRPLEQRALSERRPAAARPGGHPSRRRSRARRSSTCSTTATRSSSGTARSSATDELIARGDVQDPETVAGAHRSAPRARSARRWRRSPRTPSQHMVSRSASCSPASSSCRASTPTSATARRSIVVRGVDHKRDLQALRPYIRDVRPGARRRRRRRRRPPRGGLQARHDRRRHGLGHRARRCAAGPSSSSTPTPTAARPGRERLERARAAAQGRPGARRPARTSRC